MSLVALKGLFWGLKVPTEFGQHDIRCFHLLRKLLFVVVRKEEKNHREIHSFSGSGVCHIVIFILGIKVTSFS